MLTLANCMSGPWLFLTARSFLTGLEGLRAKSGPRTVLTEIETRLFQSPNPSFLKTMKYKPGTGRDIQTLSILNHEFSYSHLLRQQGLGEAG